MTEGTRDSSSRESDALSDAFYEARRAELQKRVSEKRFAHTEGVAGAAVELATIYGLDVRKARLAGLLHDWDKGYDDPGILDRVQELGLRISAGYLAMPRVLHGMTAAAALSREFPEIPADVIQAIDRHTVGAVDMSDLDMAVYIADLVEPGRTFGEVDEVRSMVGKESLEDLFYLTYRFWIVQMVRRNNTLAPGTIEVWNEYAMRYQSRHPHKKKGMK